MRRDGKPAFEQKDSRTAKIPRFESLAADRLRGEKRTPEDTDAGKVTVTVRTSLTLLRVKE